VRLLNTTVIPTETDEPVEVPFLVWIWVAQGTKCQVSAQFSQIKGHISRLTVKYEEYSAQANVIQ